MNEEIKPTYEELLVINPLLRRKSKGEVEELINTILECGYEWDDVKKYFHNRKINISVRTQGLDLFDPQRFIKAHKVWSSQNYISGQKLAHKYLPKLFILLIIDFIFGWIFIPIKIWLISLVVIMIIIFIIRHTAHKKVNTKE